MFNLKLSPETRSNLKTGICSALVTVVVLIVLAVMIHSQYGFYLFLGVAGSFAWSMLALSLYRGWKIADTNKKLVPTSRRAGCNSSLLLGWQKTRTISSREYLKKSSK
jgi:hypothetical protein